jgi:hypothetical protein
MLRTRHHVKEKANPVLLCASFEPADLRCYHRKGPDTEKKNQSHPNHKIELPGYSLVHKSVYILEKNN